MIVRKRKKKNFTTLDNGIFKNRDLSMKAKGLLCILLSLPDDWEYSISGLASLSTDGKDAVRSTLNELEEQGYFRRAERRDETGHFKGYDYIIFEDPTSEEPMPCEPMSLNTTSVKPTQLNTKELNTKVSRTNKSNTKSPIEDLVLELPVEMQDVVRAFIDMRKKMKSPMTEYALKLLINKTRKLAHDDVGLCIEILEQSIANGWKSVYPLTDKRQQSTGNQFIDMLMNGDVYE